jgi:hypothetical protein
VFRLAPPLLLAVAALALTGCGETPRPSTEPRVKLTLDAPDDGDMTRLASIEVRGEVTPADATVRVMGQEATVTGGEFTYDVPLQAEGNVIDVTATAPGRRPATDALRVERDMRVQVPELTGRAFADAQQALEGLGLPATEQRGGSWIDRLLPGDIKVCSTTPASGQLVEKGTGVTVLTNRNCG